MASTPLSQAARESVYRSSAGNPLFALEMASSLALQGDDHVGSALPVAAGISALVDDRLRSHTAQTQDALICAAVIGREASEELWSAALGISVADLPPIKSQCLATGLLEVGNGPQSWSVRFHHDLVREALVGSAHTDTVRRAHERLVARLSSLVDEGNYSALEPLAHHALLAPQCFEIDTVLGWVLAASRRAQSTCAYEKSLALLERARETLGAGLDNHGAFTLALAQAHQLLGKPEKAMQLLHSALEASRDEPGAYAEAVLVSGARYALGDLHLGLVERIDEALARLKPDDIPLRARLLSRKAAALTPAQHPEETLQLARQAWKLSEQISDPANQLEVLVGVGSAMADFAHPDERIPVNQRLVQLASASGDRALALRGLSRLVTDYVEGGQVARAEQLLAERNELANDLKLPRFGWMETLFDSMRAMMDGRIDESKNAIDRAEVACSGLADAERCLAIHKTWHRLLLDDQDALREYEPTALATLRTMPPALSLAVRVAVAHRRGDLARCKDELAGLSVDLPHCATNTLATLTEAVTAVGRDELVEAFIEHLKPHSGTLAVWGLFGLTCGPPIDASLGLLYGRRGDTEKAAEHFSRALALASQLGARAHRPWIRYWQAQALGANGPTPSEVAAAADEARDLGMDHLARRLSEDRATPPDEAAPLQPQLAITEVGEGWRIDHSDQERFVLKDLKGLRMLARLVNEPNREIHALELAGDGQAGSPDVGDSGEHLDDQAIEAYRARLEELAEMTSRAEAVGHTEAAERARSEDAALRSELARALGLGGRKRRAGAASERARTSAQRRIRAAIARIAAQSPILGEHLRATIRTGTYCCYRLRPR